MIISTKGRYALRMVIDIAKNEGNANVALKSVAKRESLSEKYLESIAKVLVSEGILVSVRGKNGGYRLAEPAEKITAGRILYATEEGLSAVGCFEKQSSRKELNDAMAPSLWTGLDRVISEYLGGITVADLTGDSLSSFRVDDIKEQQEFAA